MHASRFPARRTRLALAVAVTLALAPTAHAAAAADDIAALRQAIAALKADTDRRLADLESRLQAAQASVPAPTPTPPPAEPAPPAPAPVISAGGGGANAFNPSISLILSGTAAHTSQDPATYRLGRLALPPGSEIGPGTRGFSLAESELALASSIDPWLRGAINISLHPDDTVSVEEATIQTTSLPDGLGLKAGRFFSGVGYLNSQHGHTWDFVDNPLAYQAFLGTQYGDDGVQLHWLTPTDRFIELGLELGRGRSYPGSDASRNGAGMVALTAHTGDDIGDSSSWRAGLSVLQAHAQAQDLDALDASGQAVNNQFTGRTRVWVADAVWKWAPDGNATRTNFKLQGEFLHSTRQGELTYDTAATARTGAYSASQSGWYLQGVWQFMPGWRAGLRTERLSAGTVDYSLNADALDVPAYAPRKTSLMVDFNASEFSRVRLQLARDLARPGAPDTQVFLQYQTSLGAHGAHAY